MIRTSASLPIPSSNHSQQRASIWTSLQSERCGLSLIGDPEPEMRLVGAACPNCGEDDLNWLSVEDGSETAHCDRCGTDFGLPDPSGSHVSVSRLPAERRRSGEGRGHAITARSRTGSSGHSSRKDPGRTEIRGSAASVASWTHRCDLRPVIAIRWRASCRIARTATLATSPSFLTCLAISPR